LIITSQGWKLLYWVRVSLFLIVAIKVFTAFIVLLRKYYFSSIWFLRSFVTSRLMTTIINIRQKAVLFIDQGVLESIGPSFLFRVFRVGRYKLIFSYTTFILSFFFFFIVVL
jgi:hypothetical protein